MKLHRTMACALAGALLAAPLVTIPATAATARSVTPVIDPVARAAFEQAVSESGKAMTETGGTMTMQSTFELSGARLSSRTVIDRGADGILRVRSRQDRTRTDVVLTPSGRSAVPVTGMLRRALTNHGMKRPPGYIRPRQLATSGRSNYRLYDELSDPGRLSEDLDDSLVGLTSTSAGTRTTYSLTLTDQAQTVTATAVTVDGLLASIAVGEQATMSYTYADMKVTFPESRPSGLKRRVAEREYRLYSMAGSMGMVISILHPKATTKVKRARLLQRMFAKAADGAGLRITVRDLPRGVEISSTVRGWRHPLTWRIVATRHSVKGSPIATA